MTDARAGELRGRFAALARQDVPVKIAFSVRNERTLEAAGYSQLCGLALVEASDAVGRLIRIRSEGGKLVASCALKAAGTGAAEAAEAYSLPPQAKSQTIGAHTWITVNRASADTTWIKKTAAAFCAEFIIVKPGKVLIAAPVSGLRPSGAAAPTLRRIRCPGQRAAAKRSSRRRLNTASLTRWLALIRPNQRAAPPGGGSGSSGK